MMLIEKLPRATIADFSARKALQFSVKMLDEVLASCTRTCLKQEENILKEIDSTKDKFDNI